MRGPLFRIRSILMLTLVVVGAQTVFSEEAISEMLPENNSETARDWILYLEALGALSPEMEQGEVLVPLDILSRSELGDHFETITPDRPDMHNAFGNPDAHMFHTVMGNDKEATSNSTGGSFGDRNGGGRRLMVTHESAKLSVAIMQFMRSAKDIYVPPSEAQAVEIRKAIRALGSDDFQERDSASKKIESIGPIALPVLDQELVSNKDPEVVSRLQELLKSIKGQRELTAKAKAQLKEILLRFRSEHPPAKSSVPTGEQAIGASISGKVQTEKK